VYWRATLSLKEVGTQVGGIFEVVLVTVDTVVDGTGVVDFVVKGPV